MCLRGFSAIDLVSLSLKKRASRKSIPFVGGSASPFIDKEDGFTSERVRVRMLPSLVAPAGGYPIMVGAYNTIDVTVECQMHTGGRAAFFRDGGRRYLQNTI